MVRYHTAAPVTKCRACGFDMEVGSRVYVCVQYETGDRRHRKSAARFVCRNCAEPIAEAIGFEPPGELAIEDGYGVMVSEVD